MLNDGNGEYTFLLTDDRKHASKSEAGRIIWIFGEFARQFVGAVLGPCWWGGSVDLGVYGYRIDGSWDLDEMGG